LIVAIGPNLMLAALSEERPAKICQLLFKVLFLHSLTIHQCVYGRKTDAVSSETPVCTLKTGGPFLTRRSSRHGLGGT